MTFAFALQKELKKARKLGGLLAAKCFLASSNIIDQEKLTR
jgi:hypothetical protein